jgi:protein N-terminal amidase
VAVGYPEKVDAAEQAAPPEYYNSLVVVDSAGEKVAHYRKSFLYYTDATWAREGQGFYGGKLGSLGQAAMGICMDIK